MPTPRLSANTWTGQPHECSPAKPLSTYHCAFFSSHVERSWSSGAKRRQFWYMGVLRAMYARLRGFTTIERAGLFSFEPWESWKQRRYYLDMIFFCRIDAIYKLALECHQPTAKDVFSVKLVGSIMERYPSV